MNIFIIIPAYNEEKTIGSVVNEVKEFGQVVVIDDASVDATKLQANAVGAIALAHLVNRGQGAALQTGTNYALAHGADIIVHFDADGQHQANDINKIIKPILSAEVEIVLGSRFLENKSNIPLLRFLLLKAAVLFTQFISGIQITDVHNGFRAFSRKAAGKIKITQDRMAHASEILDEIIKNNLPYQEVSVQVKYTDYSIKKGQSSLNFIKILQELVRGKVFK